MTCVQSLDYFFLLDIIILAARRKEANNYVTQKTISPPRLGRSLVLPLLPFPPFFYVLLPLLHINVSWNSGKLSVHKLPSYLFLMIPVRSKNKKEALITIPAVQGYLKVLVRSVSQRRREEGGGMWERRRMMQDKEGERSRDKGDVGKQVVSEWKCVGEGRWGGQAVKLLQHRRHHCTHCFHLGLN